jgi:hypothetical protein
MGKRGQEARERRGFGWLLNGGPAKRHQTDADTNGNRQGAPSPGERVWVLHAGAGCRSLYWAARQVLRVYLDSGRRRREEVAGGRGSGGRRQGKGDYKLTFDERGVRD